MTSRKRAAQRRTRDPESGLGGEQVEGRRAVRELLAARRRPVRGVWMAQGLEPAQVLDEIETLAAERHVRIEIVSSQRLDREARTRSPQGVLARAGEIAPVTLEELASPAGGGDAFLVVVAGVTDPQNLGALLRSAECAGATGVVLARHRAVHLSPTVTKVAAGAVEHLAFSLVGGVPSALERLSKLGVRSFGLAAEAPRSIHSLDLSTGPVAVVVGGEERGLPQLARRRCDDLVAIPQYGSLESLNASVAAGVACFEVARQRSADGATRRATRAAPRRSADGATRRATRAAPRRSAGEPPPRPRSRTRRPPATDAPERLRARAPEGRLNR